MMTQPIPERPSSPKSSSGSWVSIFLAVMLGLAGLITLSFLTLGYFIPVLVIGGLLFGVIGFHYFVWGWWLHRIVQDEQQEED